MKADKKTIITVTAIFVIILAVMIALVPIQKKNEFNAKWGKLAKLAETDSRARYITEHEELYPEKILDIFYSWGEEYLQFVYDYPQHCGDYASMTFTEQELNSEEVPALYMEDARWAYEDDCRVRFNGCAAVSLTMANLKLKHDSSVDPVMIMRYADQMGYIGTWGGIKDVNTADVCKAIGLKVSIINFSENMQKTSHADLETIKSILDKGHVIMAGMSGETFGVHAIIIRGYDGGSLFINDPANREHTETPWDFDRLESEMVYLYELYL